MFLQALSCPVTGWPPEQQPALAPVLPSLGACTCCVAGISLGWLPGPGNPLSPACSAAAAPLPGGCHAVPTAEPHRYHRYHRYRRYLSQALSPSVLPLICAETNVRPQSPRPLTTRSCVLPARPDLLSIPGLLPEFRSAGLFPALT